MKDKNNELETSSGEGEATVGEKASAKISPPTPHPSCYSQRRPRRRAEPIPQQWTICPAQREIEARPLDDWNAQAATGKS